MSTMQSRLARFVPLNRGETRAERFEQKAGFNGSTTPWPAPNRHSKHYAKRKSCIDSCSKRFRIHAFVYDARTLRLLVVNDAAIRRYGYCRGEFLRMKVTDLSAPECFTAFKGYCQNLSSSQFVTVDRRDGIFRHRKKDGRLIDIEIDAALIPLRGRRMFLLSAQGCY